LRVSVEGAEDHCLLDYVAAIQCIYCVQVTVTRVPEEYYTTVLTPQGHTSTGIASPQSSALVVNVNVWKCHPDCIVAIHCLCSVHANLRGESDTFWTPHGFLPRCINWIAMPQSGASVPLTILTLPPLRMAGVNSLAGKDPCSSYTSGSNRITLLDSTKKRNP
jgi:hypothetical protein